MRQSITYYLTILTIKIKGIKKIFSEDPINFKKLRKDDIHHPKISVLRNFEVKKMEVLGSIVTQIESKEKSEKLVLYIHGGAFVSGPAQHHWNTVKTIAKKTNYKIWMCDYPKAPENDIFEISNNIDAIYSLALKNHGAKDICIVGDSAGATLITALIQRLTLKTQDLPAKIILICPVMDASMENEDIAEYDLKDPMLSKKGVLSSNVMCASSLDLKNSLISPLYGSFENFPNTTLVIAGNDIMYPDNKLAEEKLIQAKVNLKVIEGENMPHIWPILPVMKEAKLALDSIIQQIKSW